MGQGEWIGGLGGAGDWELNRKTAKEYSKSVRFEIEIMGGL